MSLFVEVFVVLVLTTVADPPSNVTVETVSSTSVIVAWQPVGDVPGMLVNYIIVYDDGYNESTVFAPSERYR